MHVHARVVTFELLYLRRGNVRRVVVVLLYRDDDMVKRQLESQVHALGRARGLHDGGERELIHELLGQRRLLHGADGSRGRGGDGLGTRERHEQRCQGSCIRVYEMLGTRMDCVGHGI